MPSARARSEISRDHLIERLGARFEHRVTLVVGGAGIGKSTLLTQIREDRDALVTCTSMDSQPHRLFGRLLTALGSPAQHDTGDPTASAVADSVLSRAPDHVCVVLDDTHRLADLSAVAELLDLLPLNGHLLISSRRAPDLALGRLDAAGELLEIGEDELRFSPEEIERYAHRAGVNTDALSHLDGWPAFMALAEGHSVARSRRYLVEEVLSGLDEAQRRAIAILSLTEGYDDGFVEAVTGWDPDLLVAGLPLVRRTDDGWRVHDLWGDLLAGELDPGQREAAIVRAVNYRLDRDEFDEAIHTASRGRHPEAYRAALLQSCLRPAGGPITAAALEHRLEQAPPGVESGPEIDLARGLLAREHDPGGRLTIDHLARAMAGFSADGRFDVEAEVGAHLAYPLYLTGDLEGLARLYDRATELSELGVPGIDGWQAFARGLSALQSGDSHGLLHAMYELQPGTVPEPWMGLRDFLTARALIALGRPSEAVPIITGRRTPVAVPGSQVVLGAALWYSGSPEVSLAQGATGAEPGFGSRDRFLAHAYSAVALAFAGRRSKALDALDSARAAAGAEPSLITRLRLTHSCLVVRHVVDDDPAALEEMDHLIDTHGLGHPLGEMVRQQIAWHHVTGAGLSDRSAELDPGPSHRQALGLARLLVAVREDGPAAVHGREWPPPGIVAANLPVEWAAELAVAGSAAGRPEGLDLARWLCEHWGQPARRALTAAGERHDLEADARRLLARVPTPPEEKVEIRILGPVELWRDERQAHPEDWRRERVRALALYLVTHRRARRETVAAALWPDRPPDQAAQNLRRTLAYLNPVLEPQRARGDAPWFLRADDEAISVHPSLGTDLDRFERLMSEADEAQVEGRAADVISLLEQGLKLRRGPLGDGTADQEWADGLRREFDLRCATRAVRLAQLQEARGDMAGAVRAARTAMVVDPWNEEGHTIGARAELALGHRASAQVLLERLRHRLAELGLTPGSEALEIESLLRGSPGPD